jgi:8-oxo-dGTP pyrophosphatase MutT (NUDIX family)
MMIRVRAIIIVDDSILLIHRIKGGLEYWVFPGGGVEESDQSPKHALQRECLEEIGIEVLVGDFFADKIKKDESEQFYYCKILSGEIGTGNGPEFQLGSGYAGIYEFQWVPITELKNYNVKPEIIKMKILKEGT